MARLPELPDRRVARPQRGIAQVTGETAVADAVARAGQQAAAIGDMVLDREATAAAKERDAQVSDQFRALLYDPENGYLNKEGGVAVGDRDRVLSEIDRIKKSATEGLNRAAASKLESSLDGRVERAQNAIESHASGARKTWIEGASQSRIEAFYQDSLVDLSATPAALAGMMGELEGRAVREGWSADKLVSEQEKLRSKLYADQAAALGEEDPVAAMTYIRQHADEILPSDMVNIERTVGRGERKARGEARAEAAYHGDGGIGAEAMVALGKAGNKGEGWLKYSNQDATRNDPLDPRLVDAMSFLGDMGITMNVVSGGQEAAGEGGSRTGSTRHDHGRAGDVDFYKDGKKLDPNNPDDLPVLVEIIQRAKTNGVTGFGEGDDYMGSGRIHLGFGNPGVWGAGGKGANAPAWLREAYDGVPQGTYKGGETEGDLAYIEDPVERDAAQARWRELSAADAGRREAFSTAANDDIAFVAANGVLPPRPIYSDEIVDAIYPPAQAAEVKAAYQQAVEDAQAVYGVATASPAVIEAQLAEAMAKVQTPGKTVEDVNRLDTLQKAVTSRNAAIVEDPAGYQREAFKEVPGLMDAYTQAPPEGKEAAARAYVATLDHNYDHLGVPADLRPVLPKTVALDMAAQFNQMTPDIAAQAVTEFVADWGDAAPRIMRDLGAAGLTPEYVVAARHADNPGLSAAIMSLRGQDVAALSEGLPKTSINDGGAALVEATAEYRTVFEAGDGTGQALKTFNESYAVGERLMLQYIRSGLDPAEAAARVATEIFPETPVNTPVAQVLVPVGMNAGLVERGLDQAMSEDAIRAFNPAPLDDPRIPEFADQEVFVAAAQDGVWLNNSTGDGAVLHLNIGGYLLPVTNAAGELYDVKFGAAEKMGTGQSRRTRPTGLNIDPAMDDASGVSTYQGLGVDPALEIGAGP